MMRLIDADVLLEAICKKCPEYDCKPDATDTVSGCLIYDVISSAPSINAQLVKRGKWSEYSRNALETYIECTNCCVASRPIHLQMVTKDGSGLPDFCPNCGARMEVDEDGTRD